MSRKRVRGERGGRHRREIGRLTRRSPGGCKAANISKHPRLMLPVAARVRVECRCRCWSPTTQYCPPCVCQDTRVTLLVAVLTMILGPTYYSNLAL
jgi:hypothetical protein